MTTKESTMALLRQRELILLQQLKQAALDRESGTTGIPEFTLESIGSEFAFSPLSSIGDWVGTTEDMNVSHTQTLNLAEQLDVLGGTAQVTGISASALEVTRGYDASQLFSMFVLCTRV